MTRLRRSATEVPGLGPRVKRLRREREMSQAAVAAHMVASGHVTWVYSTVSSIELGLRHLRFNEGFTLAALLRVSPHDLAYGSRTPEIPMVASHVQRLIREREALCERLVELDRMLAVYAEPVFRR